MKDDVKFFKNLLKKIDKSKEIIEKMKKETNEVKKAELLANHEMECEEIAMLILGKMNMIWQKIEKMPSGEAKDYEIFKYDAMIDDLENIVGIKL
jgi:DNA-binding transcriptional regulator GbsR (MarR family)